jgi:hypothetical protein
MLVQVGQSSLNGYLLTGEIAPLLCGFVLNVILRGVPSSLLVGC